MKFKDIFFLSVFPLFLRIQCLQSSPKLNSPTLLSSRMKSKNEFNFQARATNELKFNNMAFSMEKLQELNQLYQNLTKELGGRRKTRRLKKLQDLLPANLIKEKDI